MNREYEFSMPRSWALTLTGCLAAVGVLIFLAGTIAGLLYSEAHRKTAPLAPPSLAVMQTKSSSSDGKQDKVESTQPAPALESSPSIVPSPVAASTSPTPVIAGPSSKAKSDHSATTQENSQTAGATNSAASSSDLTKSAANSEATDNVSPTVPAAKASLAIPLAVQLGAFSIKSNAETLVQSLGDKGFKPFVSKSIDARGRQWYLVRLGPYDQWGTATRVAARVSLMEDLKPVIGPMR